MSRACVPNSDADPEPLPDRPISSHPNFVTQLDSSSRRQRTVRTAPLAQALLGRQQGESTSFQGGEAEILGIEV